MERPYVNLNSENKFAQLMNEVHSSMDRFLAFGEVVAVMLSGGLSRGYGDHLSDIDITVFLTKEQYEKYRVEKTLLPLGITQLNGYIYDIKIQDYEEALARQSDTDELWDLSYAEILYDPHGKLAELIKAMMEEPPDTALAERFLFEAWWNFQLAGDVWIYRNDVLQGHYALSNAIKPLIGALFIANGEHVPHDKWLIHMSRTLPWKPPRWEQELAQAMSTGRFDRKSLIARQGTIARLWSAIDARLREQTGAKVKMMQRYFYDRLTLLMERGRMPLAEWQAVSRDGLLNSDPFHPITQIADGMIMLDVEKLRRLRPEDMYSWFYEVVEAVTVGG